MYISEIIKFNKKDSEAELCISDGDYSVICYAYPVKTVTENQRVSVIHGILCTEIVREFEQIYSIHKLPQYYSYQLTAKVLSKKSSIVQIGDLIIHLDTDLPNDILEGEYVSFRVQRLDLGTIMMDNQAR